MLSEGIRVTRLRNAESFLTLQHRGKVEVGYLQDYVSDYKKLVEQHGAPEEVTLEEAKSLPHQRVWTMWSREAA